MPHRTPKKRGARTRYTEERANIIIDTVSRGNHITTACAHAGISTQTLYVWLDKANHVEEAIAKGQPYDHDWAPYLDLRDRLIRARADAEARMVSAVVRDASGGFLTNEEPVMEVAANGATTVARDDDGEILYKRAWASPNGRIALAFLSRFSPGNWAEKQRLEVTGADGEALQLFPGLPEGASVKDPATKALQAAEQADVLALAARLATVARERREGVDEVEEPLDVEWTETPEETE